MDFSYTEVMDQIRIAEMSGDVDAEEYWHQVLEDMGEEYYEDDGQPSEMDEWQDFDPDC